MLTFPNAYAYIGPGQEEVEPSTIVCKDRTIESVQYKYRFEDGTLFITAAGTVTECRKRRKEFADQHSLCVV